MDYSYIINEVSFVQKEIVAEQYMRIMGLIGDKMIEKELGNKKAMMVLLGTRIVEFFDIILTTTENLKMHKIEFLSKNLTMKDMEKIAADFFTLTDLSLIINGVTGIAMKRVAEEVKKQAEDLAKKYS